MRNDPQNPGNNAKPQAHDRLQEHERSPVKQGAPVQGKDSKIKKAKSSGARNDERSPGRSH